jgi:hypothetical protein
MLMSTSAPQPMICISRGQHRSEARGMAQMSECRDDDAEDSDQKGNGHTALGKPVSDSTASALDTSQTGTGTQQRHSHGEWRDEDGDEVEKDVGGS